VKARQYHLFGSNWATTVAYVLYSMHAAPLAKADPGDARGCCSPHLAYSLSIIES